jgi:ribosomal-protein-serine acetyltransferase
MQISGLEKQHFPETILADRVTLKRHEVTLAEKMFQYVDQDRKRLREFLPWVDLTRTINDELSYIQMTHEKWANHELYDYGIFRNSDGLYLGNVGVHNFSWAHRRCEIGYWILGSFEGQGFMSDAVTALEKSIFGIGFQRIEIRCSSANLRSARVPRRCGYRLEGVFADQAIESGRFRDTFVFAKLREHRPSQFRYIGHQPIGWVKSERKEAIDDLWDAVESSIQLDSNQFKADALMSLDSFSHAEVIFHMDQVEPTKIESGARHPRNNPNWPRVGIFAQRGKNRPNQIGSTVCKIKSVNGLEIHLEGLDAIDGTPVLDIKPWVKEFAPRGAVRQPEWISELMNRYWA